MVDEYPFDTPEIAALQEGHSVSFAFTWMDTPIFDTLGAIYRYQGGWAFEDWCPNWRPWSEAWEKLCDAPYVVGYRSYAADFAVLRQKMLEWHPFK